MSPERWWVNGRRVCAPCGTANGTGKAHDLSLEKVSGNVEKHKGQIIPFKMQPSFSLRVGGLEGTFHEGQDYLLECCENLYLPQPTRMVVVGTVDNVPCLATGQQLVILLAEGGGVYAYEEEALHKVAESLAEFLEIGLQLLGKEVYLCAEHLAPLSEEERGKDPEIQKIRQSADDFIKRGKNEFQSLLDLLP